jgi:protoheme IX farnesyltransferase
MLPVVVGEARAARVVWWSTLALAAASVLPAGFGAGPVYVAAAAAGSGWFLHKAWRLARMPNRATALGAFFASLVHLSLVLAGATIDGLLR